MLPTTSAFERCAPSVFQRLDNWTIFRKCWVQICAVIALTPSAAWADVPLEIQEVATGIYVHQGKHQLPDAVNRGEIANIGFIVGDKCVAVIDTGGSPDQGAALKSAIAARTRVPVCYVVNTHVHPDHIYGNLVFKQPGIRFLGHPKLAQAMATRAPFYMEKARRDLGLKLGPEHFVAPNQAVDQPIRLDLGGRTLTLTPHGTAHTDSDLSVYDDKTHTLWLADLLFMGHVPVIDGSLNGWLRELKGLMKIEATLAIPGHGPVASEWPKAAEAEVHYLEGLREELRAYVKQGKTMEQAMAEAGRSLRDHWELFDEFHKRNIATAFAELEWEGD